MKVFSEIEKGAFLKLFNRGGYVLDFSTNDFDIFTMASIGIPLCAKYELSKGKSLIAYLSEASDVDGTKLLRDLLEYYEINYKSEYDEEEKEKYLTHKYNPQYANLYKKCKDIILKINKSPFEVKGAELQEKFSSEYISKQIDLMLKMQKENPTEAIGKAKELIESCCKTILEEKNEFWSKNWDIGKLTGKTLEVINLVPDKILGIDKTSENIKAVLGNLRSIPIKLAEIRNLYGSGHGKSASFSGLEIRHAKLAVGCSITFVTFLWDTYEENK